MNYKLTIVLVFTICFFVGVYNFFGPFSALGWAKQISSLNIAGDCRMLQFSDSRSWLFGGGIVCGELIIQDNHLQTTVTEAVKKGYVYIDSVDNNSGLSLVTQRSCWADNNPSLKNHKRYFKLITNKMASTQVMKTQVTIVDIEAKRLYFFTAESSEIF